MCIFSFSSKSFPDARPLEVTGTRIFARGLADGRQVLVYSMNYASQVDVAMVLPLPTPPVPGEDAVRFIDLSDYGTFFTDLDKGFPDFPYEPTLSLSAGGTRSPNRRPLVVHEVGSFEASFVPSQTDFARLDPRFRLPEAVLDRLPEYRDYAFAVFKLKPGDTRPHPMAFRFPRRHRKEIFFPTVHVHDGTVPESAAFDHTLYCQGGETGSDQWKTSYGWHRSRWERMSPAQQQELLAEKVQDFKSMYRNIEEDRARALAMEDMEGWLTVKGPAMAHQFMNMAKTRGIVDGEAPVAKQTIRGQHPNADTLVPAMVAHG